MKKVVFILITMYLLVFICNFNNVQAITIQSKPTQAKLVKTTNAPIINRKIERDTSVDDIIEKILGVAEYICYGAAIIVVIVKGVQFMNAAPEAKADVKKQAIAVAVGALILFGISRILNIIQSITTHNIFK